MAIVLENPADMRVWADVARRSNRTVALVPTMGALHRGHLELFETASKCADAVVASIFVNPLQFGDQGDFLHYPRPLDDDLRSCESAGVDVVYVPTAQAMYPGHFATSVHVAGLTDTMEGASRPGHFDGVATVVTKLFSAVRPHVAVFGEKDFQQLAIVRRLTLDLDLGIDIMGHPIIRELDGLAMSSRNRQLSKAERSAARCVPMALAAGRRAVSDGADPAGVVLAVTGVVETEPLAELDYVAIIDAETLRPIEDFMATHRQPGRVRLVIAAQFGDVRLIDNTDPFAA